MNTFTYTFVIFILWRFSVGNAFTCPFHVKDENIRFDEFTEKTIAECLRYINWAIKTFLINNSTVTDLGNILKGMQNVSSLKELTVYRSGLKSARIAQFLLPNLNNLNLSNNNIHSFEIGNMPNLKSLIVDRNMLQDVKINRLNFPRLENLDLSDNILQSLDIESMSLRVLNLSNAIMASNSLIRIIINDIDKVDLSSNNLTKIFFLEIQGTLNSLVLKNNRITELRDIRLPQRMNSQLSIDITSNPLQCSVQLISDLLDIKKRNITFTEEVKCSFPNSTNTYSVSKYGWWFDSEDSILEQIWSLRRLMVYMDFREMNVLIVAQQKGLSLKWTATNSSITNIIALFKSNDEVLLSKHIEVKGSKSNEEIQYESMDRVSVVCIQTRVERQTIEGVVYEFVTVHCQGTKCSWAESNDIYKIVIGILSAFIGLLIAAVIWMYCKIKSSRTKVVTETIGLQDMANSNPLSPGLGTPKFHDEDKRKTEYTDDCYVLSSNVNHNQLRNSTMDNIYDDMETVMGSAR